jgi:hypothetical protein
MRHLPLHLLLSHHHLLLEHLLLSGLRSLRALLLLAILCAIARTHQSFLVRAGDPLHSKECR